MAKKQSKKLTLEDLIARKVQKEQDKYKLKEVYVITLDGNITIEKCNINLIIDAIDNINKDDSMTNTIQVYKNLIYNSAPILRKKELLDQYELVEPYDIVTEIFELGDIFKLGEEILSLYNLNQIGDEVKK